MAAFYFLPVTLYLQLLNFDLGHVDYFSKHKSPKQCKPLSRFRKASVVFLHHCRLSNGFKILYIFGGASFSVRCDTN